MVELLHFSLDPAFAAGAPFSIQERRTTPGTGDQVEIQDTVTLSAAALRASRSSNIVAFPSADAASPLGEFPVEKLLERGDSASQIAIDLGIPTQTLDADLGIQPMHTAA